MHNFGRHRPVLHCHALVGFPWGYSGYKRGKSYYTARFPVGKIYYIAIFPGDGQGEKLPYNTGTKDVIYIFYSYTLHTMFGPALGGKPLPLG
jgi:hypothetical protein